MNLTIYKEWIKQIYKRDNYCCTNCGVKGDGSNLAAHHKKPKSIILRENKIADLQDAIDCKELWDINNGQTLCVDCHQATETYGWKGWNNFLSHKRGGDDRECEYSI